jgi:hypothetical protein
MLALNCRPEVAMRLIMPRLLVAFEIVILLAVLSVLAYKAATRVLPLPVDAVQKKPVAKKAPQPTILDYYRKYPDRYIRVENESWVLNDDANTAIHSFSLRNLATVPYTEIEVRITYEGAGGKTLLTHDIKIQGALQGQATREFKYLKVSGVSTATRNAVVAVTKARVLE